MRFTLLADFSRIIFFISELWTSAEDKLLFSPKTNENLYKKLKEFRGEDELKKRKEFLSLKD